ncbi:hypothetical protein LXL04_012626 [Taraxacum kok-saghyz]
MSSNLLLSSSCNYEDEEFIDMEVSVSSSSSPSKTREFEFQKDGGGSINNASPADELFYKGKLLPLHLPPRVQMVKSLLNQNAKKEERDEEFITFSTPMVQSCNISPSESSRVSTELTPDEYFFDWSTELTGFIGDHHHIHPKKYYSRPWSKKLRLTQKLKASRNYLKSLFNKSACGSDAKQPVIEQDSDSDKHFLTKYLKVNTKPGSGQKSKYPTLGNVLKGIEDEGNEDSCSNRKSFSGAIKRKCSPSSTSSSSSSGSSSSSSSFSYSNGVYELCKRNSSADSELEGSIEAAIDHCKKSQQIMYWCPIIFCDTLVTPRDEQELQVPELRTETAPELAVPELELPQASPVPIPNIRELPSAIPVPIPINSGTATCRTVRAFGINKSHIHNFTLHKSKIKEASSQRARDADLQIGTGTPQFKIGIELNLQIGDEPPSTSSQTNHRASASSQTHHRASASSQIQVRSRRSKFAVGSRTIGHRTSQSIQIQFQPATPLILTVANSWKFSRFLFQVQVPFDFGFLLAISVTVGSLELVLIYFSDSL